MLRNGYLMLGHTTGEVTLHSCVVSLYFYTMQATTSLHAMWYSYTLLIREAPHVGQHGNGTKRSVNSLAS
jgi:hypothetical protein